MIENFDLNDTSQFRDGVPEKVIIKAVGVGGGGNNAVDHMFKGGIKNVSFVNINTDKQTLAHSVVPNRLVIGPGLGAGANPEVAREYAEESADKIAELFDDDTKMVFITAGMGGGTGTGAGPVVARIAKERGLLTIGIVTIPFVFEGQKKILKAFAGANEMAKHVDALLVINNERLTEIYPDYDFLEGFAKADDTLSIAARSISELITTAGRINLDFNDVNTTLRNSGSAIISSGYGEGEHRVTKAIEDALRSPLLKNRDIFGSKRLLFNIFFNPNAEEKFLMEEANELSNFVQDIDSNVEVIWGLAFDETLGNKVKMTILAAGFDFSLYKEEEDVKKGHKGRQSPVAPLMKEYDINTPDTKDKNRQRFVILSPDQMDDDEIIDYLEKNPTLTRDKASVERIREQRGTTDSPEPIKKRQSNNRIEF